MTRSAQLSSSEVACLSSFRGAGDGNPSVRSVHYTPALTGETQWRSSGPDEEHVATGEVCLGRSVAVSGRSPRISQTNASLGSSIEEKRTLEPSCHKMAQFKEASRRKQRTWRLAFRLKDIGRMHEVQQISVLCEKSFRVTCQHTSAHTARSSDGVRVRT